MNIPVESSTARLPRAPPLRVLIADDNRDGADVCAMMLGTWGHDVRSAYSGPGALEIAKTFRPHVLLLDIGMPELNGYEVAEHVRSATWGEGMMLIAISGWGQQADKERARAAGFDRHFTKPMEPELLKSLLSTVLDARHPAPIRGSDGRDP